MFFYARQLSKERQFSGYHSFCELRVLFQSFVLIKCYSRTCSSSFLRSMNIPSVHSWKKWCHWPGVISLTSHQSIKARILFIINHTICCLFRKLSLLGFFMLDWILIIFRLCVQIEIKALIPCLIQYDRVKVFICIFQWMVRGYESNFSNPS